MFLRFPISKRLAKHPEIVAPISEWGGAERLMQSLSALVRGWAVPQFSFSFSSVLGVFARCSGTIIVWIFELIRGGDRPARRFSLAKTINHHIFITKKSAIFLRVFPVKNFATFLCMVSSCSSFPRRLAEVVCDKHDPVFVRCLLIIIVRSGERETAFSFDVY